MMARSVSTIPGADDLICVKNFEILSDALVLARWKPADDTFLQAVFFLCLNENY